MKLTGGTWSSNLYFVANLPAMMPFTVKAHDCLLIAMNEITGRDGDMVHEYLAAGKKVFIDSGVFNLAGQHAKTHNVTHDEALGMAPDDIDGFDQLFAKYCSILSRIGESCWGYIEIDLGGRENKIKTRKRIESLGLKPIPVYHPLIDGWDYFDELASTYDRICVGNLVHAHPNVRERIIATIFERKRNYPDLWIHLLGVSPSQLLNAYPLESCDSSALSSMTRWPSSARVKIFTSICLQAGPPLSYGYVYERGVGAKGETGYGKAHTLGGYAARFVGITWQSIVGEYEASGLL